MTEDEMLTAVEAIIAREREWFDVGDVKIMAQVGSLAKYGADRRGATFGPSPEGDSILIVIDPSAFSCEAGIDHIVRHELVHVAHGTRFGDDKEAAFEWVVDELARVVAENRELSATIYRLRHEMMKRYNWSDEGMEAHMGGNFVAWYDLYLALKERTADERSEFPNASASSSVPE